RDVFDVREGEANAVDQYLVAADEVWGLISPRCCRRDELLVGNVENRRVQIDGVAPVTLDPDTASGPAVLVQRESAWVSREPERQRCHGDGHEGRRLRNQRVGDHVAARELGELDAEERPARRVGDRWREVLLDDEPGRPSRERVTLGAEERG